MTLFLDASATVAMIAGESGAESLAVRLDADPDRIASPVSRWEAIVALRRSHRFDWSYAQKTVDDFLQDRNVRLVPIGEAEAMLATDAYVTYGKGQHPAKLNMGDCFAYACAKSNAARLLYKGDDFARTDLA